MIVERMEKDPGLYIFDELICLLFKCIFCIIVSMHRVRECLRSTK